MICKNINLEKTDTLILYTTERIAASTISYNTDTDTPSIGVKDREVSERNDSRRRPVVTKLPLIVVPTNIPMPVTGKWQLNSTLYSIIYIWSSTDSKSRGIIYYCVKLSPLSGSIISSSSWYMISSCTRSLIISSSRYIPSRTRTRIPVSLSIKTSIVRREGTPNRIEGSRVLTQYKSLTCHIITPSPLIVVSLYSCSVGRKGG